MKFERKVLFAVSIVLLLIGLLFFVFGLPLINAKKPVIVDPVFDISYENGIVTVVYVSGSPLTNVKMIVFTSYNIVKEVSLKKMIVGDIVILDCSQSSESDLMIQISSKNQVVYTGSL